jgi:hypothetical protein
MLLFCDDKLPWEVPGYTAARVLYTEMTSTEYRHYIKKLRKLNKEEEVYNAKLLLAMNEGRKMPKDRDIDAEIAQIQINIVVAHITSIEGFKAKVNGEEVDIEWTTESLGVIDKTRDDFVTSLGMTQKERLDNFAKLFDAVSNSMTEEEKKALEQDSKEPTPESEDEEGDSLYQSETSQDE